MTLSVPISPGELLDKLTILEIKSERIHDFNKLEHINGELKVLRSLLNDNITISNELDQFMANLKSINEKLWDIEDDIRLCEKNKNFGKEFIELARLVYKTNDRRAGVKQQINELLASEIYEVKSYEDYS